MRHSDGVLQARFSRDGLQVLTGSEDRTARVWDARTGKPVTPLLVHGGPVTSVAFSGDGHLIVTGAADTVRVWDSRTGEPATPGLPSVPGVASVQFLSTVAYILARGRGGARIHPLPQFAGSGEDAVLLSTLLSGQRVDETGSLGPVTAQALGQGWQLYAAAHPGQFEFNPTAPPAEWTVPSRMTDAGVEQLDLAGHYNALLTESWHGGSSGNDLAELPPALHHLAGVTFDVRGIVQRASKDFAGTGKRTYPAAVSGIQVDQPASKLHFLHASGLGGIDGEIVARYLVHYVDGHVETIPIVYGRELMDWWTLESRSEPLNAVVALIAKPSRVEERDDEEENRPAKNPLHRFRPTVLLNGSCQGKEDPTDRALTICFGGI